MENFCDKHMTFKHHLETNTCPNRHWPPRQTTTWHNHFKINPRHLQRTFLIVFDVSFKPNIRPSLWSANTMTMSPKRLRKIFDLGGIYFNYPTIGWFSDGFKLFSIFIPSHPKPLHHHLSLTKLATTSQQTKWLHFLYLNYPSFNHKQPPPISQRSINER